MKWQPADHKGVVKALYRTGQLDTMLKEEENREQLFQEYIKQLESVREEWQPKDEAPKQSRDMIRTLQARNEDKKRFTYDVQAERLWIVPRTLTCAVFFFTGRT